MKKQVDTKTSNTGVGCLVFIIIAILLVIISFIADPKDNDETNTLPIADETKVEATISKIPVAVGNHVYYVPKDSEIEYEDILVTVNCEDYGIKSYYATGAPQTADAIIELYGAVPMRPYTNSNDIEGLMFEGVYEKTTAVVTFCFTIDDVFHAIEIWAPQDIKETAVDNIFDSICYRSIEDLREEAIRQWEEDAYEEYLKQAYDDAMRAYMQMEAQNDDLYDYARGYISRGARGYR